MRLREHGKFSRDPKLIVLSGAGLSADSGVPTYAGAGGLYDGLSAEEAMSPKTLARDPDFFHGVCDDRRVLMADATPNEAHRLVARLAHRYGERLIHITQNVDDLVERAGYAHSIHVHGDIRHMRSLGSPTAVEDIGHARYWGGAAEHEPRRGFRFRCDRTGLHYRPDLVLFGETPPLYQKAFRTMGSLHPDDMLVVIGTRGTVLPVNRWAANADCLKILVNTKESHAVNAKNFDLFMRTRAVDAVARLEEMAIGHLG
jgi:NAD-dependent deacetylase